MGLLDFSGFVGDDTAKDEFGMTQADRRQPLFTGLLKAGMLGMAAGENITPGQRAQLMGQVGGAIGDIPDAMNRNRAEAAQMQLRRQQFTAGQQKLEQATKLRAYAQTPEFAAMIKDMPEFQKAGLKFLIESGDADAVQRLLSSYQTAQTAQAETLRKEKRDDAKEAAKAAADAAKESGFGNTPYGINARNLRDAPIDSYAYYMAHQFFSAEQKNPDGTIIPKLPNMVPAEWKPGMPQGGTPGRTVGSPSAGAPPAPAAPGAPAPAAPGAPPVPGAPAPTATPQPPVTPPDAPVTSDVIKQHAATMKPNDEKVVNGVELYMDREGRVEWDTGTERYRLNRDGTVATLPQLKSDAGREKALVSNNTTLNKVDTTLAEMARLPDAILGAWANAPDAYLQRKDPEGQKIRDLLTDLAGVVIHDRSGSAVSATEMQRLGFLPQKTDTPQIIKQRLEAMKRWVDEETRQSYLTNRREYKMPPAIKERYGKDGGANPAKPPKYKLDANGNPVLDEG